MSQVVEHRGRRYVTATGASIPSGAKIIAVTPETPELTPEQRRAMKPRVDKGCSTCHGKQP